MATPIIAVEHLSKSYRLRMASGARYVALRDVLTDRVEAPPLLDERAMGTLVADLATQANLDA